MPWFAAIRRLLDKGNRCAAKETETRTVGAVIHTSTVFGDGPSYGIVSVMDITLQLERHKRFRDQVLKDAEEPKLGGTIEL